MSVLAELSSLDLPSIHNWENVNGLCMEDAEETKTTSKLVANVLMLVLILNLIIILEKSLCPFCSMSFPNANLMEDNSMSEMFLGLQVITGATPAPVHRHLL